VSSGIKKTNQGLESEMDSFIMTLVIKHSWDMRKLAQKNPYEKKNARHN
jgi:hypothetical protein